MLQVSTDDCLLQDRQIWALRGDRMVVVYEAPYEEILQIATSHESQRAATEERVNGSKLTLDPYRAISRTKPNYWGETVANAVRHGIDLSGFRIHPEEQKADYFRGALNSVQLRGGKFAGALLENLQDRIILNMRECDLRGATLRNIEAYALSMRGARLQDSTWHRVIVRNSDSGDAACLEEANLDNARLSRCSLKGFQPRGASMRGMTAVGSQFYFPVPPESVSSCDMPTMSNIDLAGAQFLGCKLIATWQAGRDNHIVDRAGPQFQDGKLVSNWQSGRDNYMNLKTSHNPQGLVDLSGSKLNGIHITCDGEPVHLIVNPLPVDDPRLTAEEQAFLQKDLRPIERRSLKSFFRENAPGPDSTEHDIEQLQSKIRSLITHVSGLPTLTLLQSGSVLICNGPVVINKTLTNLATAHIPSLPSVPIELAENAERARLQRSTDGINNLLDRIGEQAGDIQNAQSVAEVLSYGDLLRWAFARASALVADTSVAAGKMQLSIDDSLAALDLLLQEYGLMPRARATQLSGIFGAGASPHSNIEPRAEKTFGNIADAVTESIGKTVGRIGLYEELERTVARLAAFMTQYGDALEEFAPDQSMRLADSATNSRVGFRASAHVAGMMLAGIHKLIEAETDTTHGLQQVLGMRLPLVAAVVADVQRRIAMDRSASLGADNAHMIGRLATMLGISLNGGGAALTADEARQLLDDVAGIREALSAIDRNRKAKIQAARVPAALPALEGPSAPAA